MTAIYNGEFKPSLAHELGHAVKGSATVPQWQTAIREMAFDTKCNPRQNEELRADVTGVILRWLEGDSPKVADYNYLSGEPADDEHPAGEIRIKKITEVIELCNKVDKLVKA